MMMEWIWTFDPVLQHTIAGILIVVQIGAGSFVLARAGRSPLWAVLLIIPVISVIAVWAFAHSRWPRVDGRPPESN